MLLLVPTWRVGLRLASRNEHRYLYSWQQYLDRLWAGHQSRELPVKRHQLATTESRQSNQIGVGELLMTNDS